MQYATEFQVEHCIVVGSPCLRFNVQRSTSKIPSLPNPVIDLSAGSGRPGLSRVVRRLGVVEMVHGGRWRGGMKLKGNPLPEPAAMDDPWQFIVHVA